MKIEIRPATIADAVSLAPRMKQADVDEVAASGGFTPLDALAQSVALSDPDMCWCATIDGRPEIMWGVSRLTDEIGGVWLLSSEEILRIRRRFMQESVHYVALMHERYPVLTNYVDVRNTVSLMWLDKLGFKAGRVKWYGEHPFIQIFSRRREHEDMFPLRDREA